MDIGRAIRDFRGELCLTQLELADCLKLSFTTISRWENGKTTPNLSASIAIIRLANERNVSIQCLEQLKGALLDVKKNNLEIAKHRSIINRQSFYGQSEFRVSDNSRSTNKSTLVKVLNQSIQSEPPEEIKRTSNASKDFKENDLDLLKFAENLELPIYISDYETDEIVYLNKAAEIIMGQRRDEIQGRKCYRCLMNRDNPCEFCNKSQLVHGRLIGQDLILPENNKIYYVRGQLVDWQGRKAHLHIVSGITDENRGDSILLGTTLKNMPGAVVSYMVEQDNIPMTYISEGCIRLCGYTPEEILEKCRKDPAFFIYEEDRERVRSESYASMKKGEEYYKEFRIITKKGDIRWLSVQATPVNISDVTNYYGILMDITQEKSTKKRQDELLRSLPGGVVIYKCGERIEIKDLSDGFLKLSGYTRAEYEEMLHTHSLDVIDTEDIRDVIQTMKFAGEQGKPFIKTFRLNHKEGYPTWVQMSASVIEEQSDGKIYYAIVTKPTEETRIYKSITEYFDTAVCIAEYENRRIIYANAAWKKMVGAPKGLDIIGREMREFLPEERFVVSDEEIKELSQDSYCCKRVHTPQGQALLVKGRKLEWYGREAYISYIIDETDLQNSHEMLTEAMISAKALAWRYNFRTRTITDSGTFGERFGLAKIISNVPESLIEAGLIHEESVKDYRELYSETHRDMKVSYDIRTLMDGEGEATWRRIILTPVFDTDGFYIESIGTSIEITEQRAREKTYEEEVYVNRLLSKTALAVCHINLSGNTVLSCESDEERMLQTMRSGTADDVLEDMQRNIQEDTKPDNCWEFKDCKTLVSEYRKGRNHLRYRYQLKNDSRWVESCFELLTNPYNGDVEAITFLKDVTEVVTTENIIQILTRIDYEAITTINSETGEAKPFSRGHLDEVIEVQKKVGDNMKGVEEYLRKYCNEVDVDRVIQETSLPYVKKKLENQTIHTVTYSLKQGKSSIHKRVLYTYLDNSKKQILCAMQDLTDTYHQEELQKRRLAKALDQAKNASHAKSDFFSRMSHDMRTPMNGILGLTQLSKEENNPAVLRKNIQKIEEAGQYLLSLINDTLDLQKIESGKLELEEKAVFAQDILDSIVDIIKPTAQAKNIEFTIQNIGVKLDWFIRVDPVRFKQIFINLLANAIKFTHENGKVRLTLKHLGEGDSCNNVLIQVQDNGIGMSEEFVKSNLFMPFAQESNELSTQNTGSGLGLSIVHSLVEMMGGKIIVDSELGEGTTFSIYMRFSHIDKEEIREIRKQHTEDINIKKYIPNEQLVGKKVLLVEDHPLNAEIMQALLERERLIVVWAEDGQKSLEIFKDSKPGEFQLVMMDIRMPIMNGLEATKAIRSLPREDAATIPIIAMTANAYEEDVKQALDAGMNYHLAKPVDVKRLQQTLYHYLSY